MSVIACNERSSSHGKEQRWSRSLRALPIVAWTLLMLRAFAMAEPAGPAIGDMYDRSLFDVGNLNVPLIKKFYGVRLIDLIFGQVTVAFAQLQFNTDSRAYWQTFVFLTEYAGLYGILLLESCRRIHRSTIFQFPVVLAFFAQLIPLGVLGPLYLYALYVFGPSDSTVSSTQICHEHVAAVLPSVVLAYYVPHFPSYFNTSLAARHWWNWVWQLYGIWGSLTFLVVSKTGLARWLARSVCGKVSLRVTVGAFAVIGTCAYWYAILESDVSLFEIFVPKYLLHSPKEGEEALRTILQYDYICGFGAGLCWLGCYFWDLKGAGRSNLSWARILVVGALVLVAFGPGTLLLLGWMVREDIFESTEAVRLKTAKKDE